MATSNVFAGTIISSSSVQPDFITGSDVGAVNVVLTPAQILGGFISATPTADRTYTLPTAVDLFAACPPGMVVGNTIEFVVQNLGTTDGQQMGIVLSAGITGSPAFAVPQLLVQGVLDSGGAAASNSGSATFMLRYSATTPAFVLYRKG